MVVNFSVDKNKYSPHKVSTGNIHPHTAFGEHNQEKLKAELKKHRRLFANSCREDLG
jgi:hypothetical protein